MQIIDITLTVYPKLPVWPGDPSIEIQQVRFMDKGDVCNVSNLRMGVHAGTHVDAPHHFLNDGQTVEKINLDAMVGDAYICQYDDDVNSITAEQLENVSIPKDVKRLLIKTRNSKLWKMNKEIFDKDFVAISPNGAEWLVERGIQLVGVDYLSVAPFGEGTFTHRILLSAGIVALEGLNLAEVNTGYYELICLPLKLKDSDGAPARVILRR
jgi:arylformamidase